MEPASAVPVRVGVVALVMLSLLDTPLSLPLARSGVEGALGAVVSLVTVSPVERGLVWLLPSVWVTLSVCAPCDRAGEVMLQAPAPLAVAVPRSVVPSVS